MDLQEALEVQVSDLSLVIHAQQLRQGRVGDDAALEAGVVARVRLHILRHILGDLRLGALRLRRQSHERAQLVRQGLLLQEGVVRTTGLPGRALLGGQRRGVHLALLLGVAGLTLGLRRRRLGRLHRLTNTSSELGRQRLQLLGQRRQLGIRAQGDRRGGSHRGDNNLRLRSGGLLLLGGLRLHLLRRGRRRRRGHGGRGLGLLGRLRVLRHLVCLNDSLSCLHF